MVRDVKDVLLHAILDLFDELRDVNGLIESTTQSYELRFCWVVADGMLGPRCKAERNAQNTDDVSWGTLASLDVTGPVAVRVCIDVDGNSLTIPLTDSMLKMTTKDKMVIHGPLNVAQGVLQASCISCGRMLHSAAV